VPVILRSGKLALMAGSEPGPRPNAPAVIAPGNHDGVHLGHQALVATARAHAHAHGLEAFALTFHPHPAAVVSPDGGPTPLTTIDRRRELLKRAGADDVIVQAFTPEFARLSPERFLSVLSDRGARAWVVGPDFRFGQGRAGDVELLQAFAAARGFEVIVEPPVLVDGQRVSSSAVREALAAGQVGRARTMLGRVHDLSGEVVRGYQRGRTLGFPTANLRTDPVLHPADGVYAVVARALDREPGQLLWGIANLGQRPTFAAERSIEVHLFDFSGDLYGARLRVGFVERIRSQTKFPDADALKRQIQLDCQAARATLASSQEGTWAWI
jgi:riboflavin kinase / FMN adenylyltransferase